MSRRRIRLPIVLVACAGLAVLLSGCSGIKAGTYGLSQPAGIGPVNLAITVCTLEVGPAPPEGPPPVQCGAPGSDVQGQQLASLVVPTGTTTPETINATPGPGAPALTFARSPELTAAMSSREVFPGIVGAPPGFTIAGYVSNPVSEAAAQEYNWALAASLGLPPGPGGGTYAGPMKVTTVIGWRNVSPEAPASRPINCAGELPPGETFCGNATVEGEATLGVTDLKMRAPAETTSAPGTRVKLPFVFDMSSSAAQAVFKLAVGSNLPGAQPRLSNASLSRRAPATTRQAIIEVPDTARFGDNQVTVTATAAQGGTVSATAVLSVAPKGNAKLKAPKKAPAAAATSKGVKVSLEAPIAGTRFIVVLKAPKPGGGMKRITRRVRVSKRLGKIDIRLRVPRANALEAIASGRALRVEARIDQPGRKAPLRQARAVKLR